MTATSRFQSSADPASNHLHRYSHRLQAKVTSASIVQKEAAKKPQNEVDFPSIPKPQMQSLSSWSFEFNGVVYPSYCEMVAAKRQRNLNFLSSLGLLSSSNIFSPSTKSNRMKKSNKSSKRSKLRQMTTRSQKAPRKSRRLAGLSVEKTFFFQKQQQQQQQSKQRKMKITMKSSLKSSLKSSTNDPTEKSKTRRNNPLLATSKLPEIGVVLVLGDVVTSGSFQMQ